MKRVFRTLFGTLYIFITASISAQTDTTYRQNQFELDELDVTAPSVSRIALLPANTISEVMSFAPELDIRSRGANGTQTDLSLRGGTFDQVDVQINGISVKDAQTGHYTMNIPLPLALIERIEVEENTVNIITVSQPEGHKVHLSMTGGSNRLLHPEIAISWAKNDWSINAAANYLSANGYYAPSPSKKEQIALDNSDIRSANLFLQARYKTLNIQAGAQYKDAGLGMGYGFGSQDQFDATRTAFGSLTYAGQWKRWSLDIKASYRGNHDHYYWHRHQDKYSNTHTLHTATLSAKSGYEYGISKTSIGVNLRNDNLNSTNMGKHNRFDVEYYLDEEINWQALSASAHIQGCWNSYFGHCFTYDAAFGWQYAQGSQLYARAGLIERLPTFTDLYYNAGNQLGNKDLDHEHIWYFTLGTRYNKQWSPMQRLTVSGNVFARLGRDIIDWVYTPSDPVRPYHAQNQQRVNTYGVELSCLYSHNRWLRAIELSYGYTYLDLNLRESGSRYLDYLSHKLVARIEHALGFLPRNYGYFGMNESLRFTKREGEAENAEGQTFSYKPVALVDASVYWQHPMVRVSIECSNIANIRYYDLGGILQPGVAVTGKIAVIL
jgi:iron complex outermembrane receptor protein